jgi:hypothetical protein
MIVPCHRTFPILVAAVALALGCASKEKLPSYKESQTATATAVVQAIDLQTREVTLMDQDGKTFSFVASDEVRNLPQVKVGDTVKVTYTESIAIDVKRGEDTAPAASAGTSVESAPAGAKPGGTVAGTVTVSARIVALDRQTSHVTLQGPQGNFRVVQVKDPKKLENVQVGDMVYATYTESVGISVEPVAK